MRYCLYKYWPLINMQLVSFLFLQLDLKLVKLLVRFNPCIKYHEIEIGTR